MLLLMLKDESLNGRPFSIRPRSYTERVSFESMEHDSISSISTSSSFHLARHELTYNPQEATPRPPSQVTNLNRPAYIPADLHSRSPKDEQPSLRRPDRQQTLYGICRSQER